MRVVIVEIVAGYGLSEDAPGCGSGVGECYGEFVVFGVGELERHDGDGDVGVAGFETAGDGLEGIVVEGDVELIVFEVCDEALCVERLVWSE